MGVSGMSRWIEEHAPDACNLVALPTGARLLIDGNGLCFYVLREAGARARAGDYAVLARAFTAALTNLRRAGMVPEIFLDGPATRLKAETLASRAAERRKQLERVHVACLDGRAVASDQLPVPPLMMEQLARCAEDAGVRLVRCQGEADPEIALECALAEAARPNSCFVLAEDSDFFFFRSVRYVRFSDLMLVRGGGGGGGGLRLCEPHPSSEHSVHLLGRAWTRQLLSEVSGLAPSRLVDWALLVGNDYTSAFPLASFGASVAELVGGDGMCSARPMVEAARVWLASQPGEAAMRLEGEAEPLLARALRYSRALYELDAPALELFPLDCSHSRSEPLELLPRAGADLGSIGAAALSELRDGCLGRVVAHLDGRQAEPCTLQPQHADALRRILRGERAPTGASALPETLSWEDVHVAQGFQSLCKLLLRAGPLPPESPSALFDGPSFHAFAQSYVPAAPTPPPRLTPVQAILRGAPPAFKDSAAYGHRQAAAAAAARCCMHCGRRDEGECDVEDGRYYCRACWEESRGCAGSGAGAGQGAAGRAEPSLPVDAHHDEIIRRVTTHRVSLICGETGCGKSSRVPQMLLSALPRSKLMVAQPRRIAAHALFARARQGADGALYGLRMGNGVRDEGPMTRCWYCTTGYLVRLAGGGRRSRVLGELSHMLIDDCHERATDSDLLCLLARRLLAIFPRLHLVLMSATLHSQLLRDYFSPTVGRAGVAEPLAVGARRFELTELFLGEIRGKLTGLPERVASTAKKLEQRCLAAIKGGPKVQTELVSLMLELVPWVARVAAGNAHTENQLRPADGEARRGGAVLIFVPGMAEIEALAEVMQGVPSYLFVPMHSELPFEEQMEAFEPAPAGVTKVIVATNVAESSITLPDIDAVIDLGLHKQLEYSHQYSSAVLQRAWVSKAAAHQRAGRTARLRPGTVYRLYPRELWERFDEHALPQIFREPLEATVLQLRFIVDEGDPISGLMKEMIESPDLSHVNDALVGLARMGMLQPGGDGCLDTASLTPMGRLAGGLPFEPRLSRMVAIGIQLGCAAEALVIAAACAQPRSPFRIVSPLMHSDPDEYNALVRTGFYGRLYFDRGMSSEPLMMVALVSELEQLGGDKSESGAPSPGANDAGNTATANDRGARPSNARFARFCVRHGLSPKQVRHFLGTIASLRKSVREITKLPAESLALPAGVPFPPPGREGSFRLALLRTLLVWTAPDLLLSANPPSARGKGPRGRPRAEGDGGTVRFSSELSDAALRLLLPPPVEWTVDRRCCDVVHVANTEGRLHRLLPAVGSLLLAQRQLDWVFLHTADGATRVWVKWPRLEASRRDLAHCVGGELRLAEMLAGLLAVRLAELARVDGATDELAGGVPEGYAFLELPPLPLLSQRALKNFSSRRGVALDQRVATVRLQGASGSLVCSNTQPLCEPPTGPAAALRPDSLHLLRELFGDAMVAKVSPGQAAAAQLLRLSGWDGGEAEGAAAQDDDWELQPPLVRDRPVGARLLCSMAAGYKDRKLRVSQTSRVGDAAPAGPNSALVVGMDLPEGLDWLWFKGDQQWRALLPRHSALKTALPRQPEAFFAVCTRLLLLGDGGSTAAVEWVTLLPPGIEWLALVLLSGGHNPPGTHGTLLTSQLEAARGLALALLQCAIEPQPRVIALLRALLEPWLTQFDEAIGVPADAPATVADDPDSTCPICYAVLHETTLQLPRVQCQTCRKKFHAHCLYTWFACEHKESSTRTNVCPLCQCAM